MIRVERLAKRFMIYDRAIHRLADWLVPARWHRGRPFWALRDLSFEIPTGASLGVVGPNGAGKSTLLKILTGTLAPTEGRFSIAGRIAGLLELGTGFHPEFTGRQNAMLNGRMIGLSEEELRERLPAILDFAELGEFIDQPLRTYSSGMVLRLGFAVAASVEPDVLIVDEALAVGDLHFQQKCLRRIREFHERGTTVLFVSHDPSLIKKFCTEAILLDSGRLIDRGRPDQVLDYYTALLAEKYRQGGGRAVIHRPAGNGAAGASAPAIENDDPGAANTAAGATASLESASQSADEPPPFLRPAGHRTGNFQAVITAVFLRSAMAAHGNMNILVTGAKATLFVRFVALADLPAATVGIGIKDRLGQEVFGVNTAYRELPLGPVAAGQAVEVSFDLQMNLGEGIYWVTAAVHTGEDHTAVCYDWVEQALTFQILPNPDERFTGLVRLRPELSARTAPAPPAEIDFARATGQALRGPTGAQ